MKILKIVSISAVLAILLVLTIGSAALAKPVGVGAPAPDSIEVQPGGPHAATFNQGPGDDQVPPQITVETPNGTVNPTL